jgi:hypothetical protein
VTRHRSTAVAAFALWILCGAYASQFIYRGWIAHDEGTIGQSAERILAGEVPHRDFDEVYTGGLTYLHAAGMKIFGVSLRTPRLIVFAFFMAFLAAVYAVGRRVSSPAGALVAMAMAAVWSLPNYFVSLPSWYNLFFATFGVLAFLRYLDAGHRRWLVIAGACGGLSVLAKISGVYYLAGGLLFLAYLEQSQAAGTARDLARQLGFWPFVAASVGVFLFLLFRMLQGHDPAAAALFLPATAVCLFVVWREWGARSGSVRERTKRLFALIWPFIAGVALPILAYVLFFWSQHGVDELIRGVLVLPQRRLAEANSKPLRFGALALGVPYVLLLLAGWRRAVPREAIVAGLVAGFLGTLLVLAGHPPVYRVIWAGALAMPMAVVVAGLVVIAGGRQPIPPAAQARVFLSVTMAAMVGLIQFPYATPIYFCYGASLTVLAIASVVFAQPKAPKRSHLAVAAFFFVFAIVFMNRSYGWNMGVKFLPYNPGSELDLPRGGLRVPDEDKQVYEELVRVLQQHAAGGTIYAGPDCPEIYFLSGFPNPTRALFDFLTPAPMDERTMAKLLSDGSIRAVVVNTAPLFSPRLEPGALRLIEARFPSSQRIGRFVVRFE